MAYQTRCPECQAKLTLDDIPAADEAIECPKCGNQFTTGSAKGKAPRPEPEKKLKKKKEKEKSPEKKPKKDAKEGNAVKVRKTKRKKSNPIILYLMAAGALIILGAIGGIGYLLFGRVGKMDEMMTHVPGDFNLIRGMNVGLISRYPGYLPELDPQFNKEVRDVAAELARAAGEEKPIDFVDYAVAAKKKQGGLAGQIFVIRTRVAIDAKAIGAKLGAESNADGTPYYRATGQGLMANAIVYSPNNRLLVVVPAIGQQDAIFRASLGGPKAKEGTMAGKYGDAGKKITSGHIWTLINASGDLQNYVKSMGDALKKDFPPLGNQMSNSKFFGTWVTFGTSIKLGAAIDCDTKDTASGIATHLTEGPLGKGDDSEIPNESKKVLTFTGSKVFKETFLANIKYTYTGSCAFLQSYMPFTKSQEMMRVFNNPSMGEGG
jgi:predicted Zn finger-like uncharacterized protein